MGNAIFHQDLSRIAAMSRLFDGVCQVSSRFSAADEIVAFCPLSDATSHKTELMEYIIVNCALIWVKFTPRARRRLEEPSDCIPCVGLEFGPPSDGITDRLGAAPAYYHRLARCRNDSQAQFQSECRTNGPSAGSRWPQTHLEQPERLISFRLGGFPSPVSHSLLAPRPCQTPSWSSPLTELSIVPDDSCDRYVPSPQS